MPVIEKISAGLDGIGHLLSDRQFVVPPYQRSYSWTADQVDDLLRDLADTIRRKEGEYFLGTVVLTKNQNGSYAVIDGQQRLATVSILICAVRDYFYAAADMDRADGLHQKYIAQKELRDLTETARLTLIASDNSFYEQQIRAKPSPRPAKTKGAVKKAIPSSHERLDHAREAGKAHVARLVQQTSEPAEVLLDWIEFLRDSAKVIVVEVNDEAAAYTIFEVLNDRGLDLTVSDLLKNFVFRTAGDKVAEAQQHWTAMASVLEASGAEDKALRTFIRHVWASQHGVTREKELYDRVRSYITSKQHALDFAKSLSDHARTYAALDNPSDELWKDYGPPVREAIEALRTLKAIQIRPLVIAILEHFDIKEVRRALPMLVCWTVRFLIVGKVGSGPLEVGYSDRAKAVTSDRIRTVTDLYTESKSFLASDDEFEQAFKTARVSAAYLARFYLRVLEKQHVGPTGGELIVNPNEDAVTLEHVMPQTREPHWTSIGAETHQAHLRRLGNLALLDKDLNEKGGNLPYTDKRITYQSSRIVLTRRIANHQVWGIQAIDQRQAELARLAVQAWPLGPR